MRLFLFTVIILMLFTTFDVSSHEVANQPNHNSTSVYFSYAKNNSNDGHYDCQDWCCDECDCDCGCSIHSFANIEITQVNTQKVLKLKNVLIFIPFSFTQHSSTPYRPPIFI